MVVAFAGAADSFGGSPVFVIVKNESGELRQETVLPAQQTLEMLTLLDVSRAATVAMTRAVNRAVEAQESSR